MNWHAAVFAFTLIIVAAVFGAALMIVGDYISALYGPKMAFAVIMAIVALFVAGVVGMAASEGE